MNDKSGLLKANYVNEAYYHIWVFLIVQTPSLYFQLPCWSKRWECFPKLVQRFS